MAISVNLYLVPKYERMKTGLWCPKCLKPSGYELPFAHLWESGVSDGITLRKCHDCDSPINRDD